ncbi:MAG: T9SS type A sorting domain-containing protein [Flavobacteriaceae bacterium]|nr:T9SS type A sorting domain-containing protein [Flavobacteriaceae bacterium]
MNFFYAFLLTLDAQNYSEYTTGNSDDLDVDPTFGVCMMGGASENDNAMIWFLERANVGLLTWNRAGEAVKVAKIVGTQNGENIFNLIDWITTEGANWGNWYVNNGSFLTSNTTNPDCNLLSGLDLDQLEINVSLNPFKHQINLQGISEAYQLDIFDIHGKIIYSATLYNDKSINLSHLQSGLYLIEISIKTKIKQLKLIKR